MEMVHSRTQPAWPPRHLGSTRANGSCSAPPPEAKSLAQWGPGLPASPYSAGACFTDGLAKLKSEGVHWAAPTVQPQGQRFRPDNSTVIPFSGQNSSLFLQL